MKTMKLYRDTDTDEIYTAWDLESNYDDMIYDLESEDMLPIWTDFQDYVKWAIESGQLEEITAFLSDRNHVYPYYYVEEDIGIQTIMEQYNAWISCRDDSEIKTFADFLDIPQVDRNGVYSWGFYK